MTESIPSGALKVADPRIAHVLDYLDWRARQADLETRPTLEGYAAAIRELAALASPAPQATPTMADALAAGDGTLHGAIDYWQKRALAAEAQATGTLREEWHAPGLGEVHSSNHDVMIYCEKRDIHDMEQGYIVDDDTARRVAAALSSAKREAEPMDMALCEIHSVVIRPGQTYTFSKVGDCEKCAAMESAAIEAYEPIGVTPIARAAASHKLTAPLARSPEPLTQLECEMLPVWQDAAPWSGAGRLRIVRAVETAHGIVAPTLQPSEGDPFLQKR